MELDIIDYLASDNYIVVNKSLIKTFGLEEAVLLGELSREYRYWKKEDKLENDMFYSTIDNIEENTGLSAHEQRQAIKSLENAGVLTTELKGIPAKKYFKINASTVVKILTTCSVEFSQQDVKKVNSNNNKNSNNKNNKSISKDIDTNFEFGKFKPKKSNLYSQCISLIYNYTVDVQLQNLLKDFLNSLVEMNKLRGLRQFQGILNRLTEYGKTLEEQYKIVNYTIDNGYGTFYELKANNNYSNKRVSSDMGKTAPQYTEKQKEDFRKAIANGTAEKF